MSLTSLVARARLYDKDAFFLIREARDLRGIVAGEFNAAQVALATWMIGTEARDGVPVSNMLGCTSEHEALRLITGETEPEPNWADLIAAATEGAVRPPMWATPIEVPAPVAAVAVAAVADALSRVPTGRPPHRPIPRHSSVGTKLDLIRRGDDIVIVGDGGGVFFPISDLPALHATLGTMLGLTGGAVG